jgi:hypothetical protein
MTRSFAMGPQISAIAALPKALRRSKVVVSNLSPNSRMRRHEASSSLCVGLLVFVTVFGTHWSQKLLGWNCAITFTGAAGTRWQPIPEHFCTLWNIPLREVLLLQKYWCGWHRFPAVHANVQGGIEYLEARLSPPHAGLLLFGALRSNSARTFFAAFSSNQVAYAHDLYFR